jgi:hypothetical protein
VGAADADGIDGKVTELHYKLLGNRSVHGSGQREGGQPDPGDPRHAYIYYESGRKEKAGPSYHLSGTYDEDSIKQELKRMKWAVSSTSNDGGDVVATLNQDRIRNSVWGGATKIVFVKQ